VYARGDPSGAGVIWVEGTVSLATGEFASVGRGASRVEGVALGTRDAVREGEIDGVGVEIAVGVATGEVAAVSPCTSGLE